MEDKQAANRSGIADAAGTDAYINWFDGGFPVDHWGSCVVEARKVCRFHRRLLIHSRVDFSLFTELAQDKNHYWMDHRNRNDS